MSKRNLSIAILGSRGIPNRYGGFEACAEKLALLLVKDGHKVAVYCAGDHAVKETEWNGIERIMIENPEKQLGTLGQFVYDLNCNLHSRKQNYDIILHLGYTSDSVWFRLWTKRSIHMVNMDGMEWMRHKYGQFTKKFLKRAERWATLRAHTLIADNPEIERYLNENYFNAIVHIAYGAEIPTSYNEVDLEPFNLKAGKYDLIVARMEPENNIKEAIKAKIKSKSDIPLVIIGNENNYKKELKKTFFGWEIIRFLEPVYEASRLNSIRHFARYYVHGHSVGGTNPSLLEAMACECNILAHNNPFNKTILEEHGRYFSGINDLSEIFLNHPEPEFVKWKEISIKNIRNKYNWEAVTGEYEQLFRDAIDS